MSDPTRYSEGGGDRLATKALRSARGDAPSRGSKERALVALGAAGAVGVASVGAKAAVPGLSLVRVLLSVVGASIVSVGVVTVGYRLSVSGGDAATSTHAAASSSMVRSPATASVMAPPPADITAPSPTVGEPLPQPVVVAPSLTAAPPARASASGGDAKRVTLSDEVAALESARAALASGDAGGALRALDRYAADFPRGVLGQEATVLRI